MTTLTDYYDMLLNHDWFYEFSDDHSVWKKGRLAQTELQRIASESPEHRKLFNGFNDHHFSGPLYNGKEKKPLPERPQ